MNLRVRRGSRHSGCPLLLNERNETVALVFSAEGQATAQERAQSIVAAVNFLETHDRSLDALLFHVASDETQPSWVRMAAASLGLDLRIARAPGEGAPEPRAVQVAPQIESAGDRRSLEGR